MQAASVATATTSAPTGQSRTARITTSTSISAIPAGKAAARHVIGRPSAGEVM